jgi:hypothetical protein
VNGYKGFVGYGIRELNQNETSLFCSQNNQITSFPLIDKQVNFTSDFYLRAYTSGCYYYDVNSRKWLADGMTLLKDTNLHQTHCSSIHLTSFAGGLVVMPNNINFQYVFANAAFSKNYTIYFTLIIFALIYIFFAIWALLMDAKDLKKIKTIPLKDNNFSDDYFYEMIVFTGDSSESGTHSNVNKKMSFLLKKIKSFLLKKININAYLKSKR